MVIEAETPIAVGSGQSDILTDAPVIRDVNRLPYIPGTSLAGVLRHALGIAEGDKDIFGHHDKDGGEGSRLIVSDAVMIGKDGETLDGAQTIDWNDDFYCHFEDLPVRQHVKMGHSGTGENGGKFDNQVVYKGTRFVFEMEVYSEEDEEKNFNLALDKLASDTLRIGSGTRCGYGKIKVVTMKRASLCLADKEQLKLYLDKSASLAEEWEGFKDAHCETSVDDDWYRYELRLSPLDFFMFGAGIGDDDADDVPVAESIAVWNDGKPAVAERQLLIPATSVKGALAHRTAYHYNKICKLYAGDENAKTGDKNPAVAAIFGVAGDGKTSDDIKRGNIILSDVLTENVSQKVLYHVKIDRFTGGTIKGALFQEKVSYGKGNEYTVEILVLKEALNDDNMRQAFEKSLADVCDGLLPLGGSVNRGNGVFTGKLYKNGKEYGNNQ